MSDNYPSRYYAAYDTSASQPTPITAYYDTQSISTMAGAPAASDMIVMTEDQWDQRLAHGWYVQNGAIIAYTPTLSLAEQAAIAYSSAVSTVQSEYGVLNEPTPDAWVTYLKALKAIRDGADTTSTTLPTAPTA